MKRYAVIHSQLGDITIAASGDNVTGLYFEGHAHAPEPDTLGHKVEHSGDELLSRVEDQLREYLSGDRAEFDLPLEAHGSEFQERVWAALDDVGYGHGTTYGALALKLGDPSLARSIGGALGANPLSILVPCHRVTGSGRGAVGGYAGGQGRKVFLLGLEALNRWALTNAA